MDASTLIGIGYIIFATLTVQLPFVLFRHHPKMTGSQLAEAHPGLAWLRYIYPILTTVWVLAFGGILFYLYVRYHVLWGRGVISFDILYLWRSNRQYISFAWCFGVIDESVSFATKTISFICL